ARGRARYAARSAAVRPRSLPQLQSGVSGPAAGPAPAAGPLSLPPTKTPVWRPRARRRAPCDRDHVETLRRAHLARRPRRRGDPQPVLLLPGLPAGDRDLAGPVP